MTDTTTLQKPFTDEELRDWAKTGGFMQSRVAKRLAARVLELEAENKRLREGLFWIADIGFVQEKHAKQHADDCCKLARETLGYQEQAALKGGEI